MVKKEITYAQETIRERIDEKRIYKKTFQEYSEHSNILMRSDYGDYSHGDYSDYYRIH